MEVTLDYLNLPKSAGELVLPPLRSPNTTYIPRYSPRTTTSTGATSSGYIPRYSPRTVNPVGTTRITPDITRPNLPTQQTYIPPPDIPQTRQLPIRSQGMPLGLRSSFERNFSQRTGLSAAAAPTQRTGLSAAAAPTQRTGQTLGDRYSATRMGGVSRSVQRGMIDIAEDDLLDILTALSEEDRDELLRSRPELAKYRDLF